MIEYFVDELERVAVIQKEHLRSAEVLLRQLVVDNHPNPMCSSRQNLFALRDVAGTCGCGVEVDSDSVIVDNLVGVEEVDGLWIELALKLEGTESTDRV